MKPDILQMDSFCEGVYDILDPSRKGYVDLQHLRLSAIDFSPAVYAFVKRVLEDCELDIEPSQIAFKEDIITRLMMAVDEEWRSLRSEEPTHVNVETSPMANPSPEPEILPITGVPRMPKHDPFLARVYMKNKDHDKLLEKLRTETTMKEMKDCTFTPTITKRPPALYPPVPSYRRHAHLVDASTWTEEGTAPSSGLRLRAHADRSFKQSLRQRHAVEATQRLSQAAKTKGVYSRAVLMHRINEADKFWHLSYNTT